VLRNLKYYFLVVVVLSLNFAAVLRAEEEPTAKNVIDLYVDGTAYDSVEDYQNVRLNKIVKGLLEGYDENFHSQLKDFLSRLRKDELRKLTLKDLEAYLEDIHGKVVTRKIKNSESEDEYSEMDQMLMEYQSKTDQKDAVDFNFRDMKTFHVEPKSNE